VPAADMVLAEVESQATRQQWETTRQEYAAAIADLRQQVGISQVAASLEPAGQLAAPAGPTPDDEAALIRVALATRPEIQSARSQVASSRAAVALARAERIPVPSVGPAYEKDESGVSYYGVGLSSPIPVWNAGGPLVRQREAEYHRDVVALEQVQERTTAQVKATLAKWRQMQGSVRRTQSLAEPLQEQVARMERLFDAGQADVLRLLQVQRRSLEGRSAQLDAVWQATQAYADLLTAIGTAPLVGSVRAANSE
jgi:outer membrane protein, heavy metal efflux system